jgi:hypothetical protein
MYSQDHPHRYGITRPVQEAQETTQLSFTLTLRHNVLRDRQLGQDRGQAVYLHQQPGRHVPRDVAVERPQARFSWR